MFFYCYLFFYEFVMTLGQAHVDLAKNLTFYFLPSDVTLGQAHVNLKNDTSEMGIKNTT